MASKARIALPIACFAFQLEVPRAAAESDQRSAPIAACTTACWRWVANAESRSSALRSCPLRLSRSPRSGRASSSLAWVSSSRVVRRASRRRRVTAHCATAIDHRSGSDGGISWLRRRSMSASLTISATAGWSHLRAPTTRAAREASASISAIVAEDTNGQLPPPHPSGNTRSGLRSKASLLRLEARLGAEANWLLPRSRDGGCRQSLPRGASRLHAHDATRIDSTARVSSSCAQRGPASSSRCRVLEFRARPSVTCRDCRARVALRRRDERTIGRPFGKPSSALADQEFVAPELHGHSAEPRRIACSSSSRRRCQVGRARDRRRHEIGRAHV